MPILPDIIDENIKLLICGYSVGQESAKTGNYYANPSNRFWRILYESGLTSVNLAPHEDKHILQYNIGLTDLVKDFTHGENVLVRINDFERLENLVKQYKPDILAFKGCKEAQAYFHYKNFNTPAWGNTEEKIERTEIWKVPDPSKNNGHFEKLKNHWIKMSEALGKMPE